MRGIWMLRVVVQPVMNQPMDITSGNGRGGAARNPEGNVQFCSKSRNIGPDVFPRKVTTHSIKPFSSDGSLRTDQSWPHHSLRVLVQCFPIEERGDARCQSVVATLGVLM